MHPRPDARHIRYDDVRALNARGSPPSSMSRATPFRRSPTWCAEVVPAQVTLVPDAPDAITSNAGWDTLSNRAFLPDIVARFRECGIRVSIFVDPDPAMVAGSRQCGADRVGALHRGPMPRSMADRERAIAPYVAAAGRAAPPGAGAQRRPRPRSGQPALFRRAHSVARRGVDRPCAHQRRPATTDSKIRYRFIMRCHAR